MLEPIEVNRRSRFGNDYEIEIAVDTKNGGVGLRAVGHAKSIDLGILQRDSHKTHTRGKPKPMSREKKIRRFRGLILHLSFEKICALHACLERLLYGGRMPWRPKRFFRRKPGVIYQLPNGRCRVA